MGSIIKRSSSQVISLLSENMKSVCEAGQLQLIRPKSKNNTKKEDDTPGNQSRKYIGADEIIFTSSLIYIGNLPWNIKENKIKELVQKYYIKASQIIKRRNYIH